jgi:hypothetical protein
MIMKKITVLFVQFFYQGLMFAETSTQDVENLDPYSVVWPDHAYAFTMHRREDVIDGKSVYTGVSYQIGGTYYHHDSKVETLDEVRKRPDCKILIQNMESNGWDLVVWNRFGGFPQPFGDRDVVL